MLSQILEKFSPANYACGMNNMTTTVLEDEAENEIVKDFLRQNPGKYIFLIK